jgi:hypothetical protein
MHCIIKYDSASSRRCGEIANARVHARVVPAWSKPLNILWWAVTEFSPSPDRWAAEIMEFFARRRSVDTRLIQSWHALQRNTMDDTPKFLGEFRGFLQCAVT